MYSQAEWPPLDTFPAYLGVAMVTIAGLVTCSVIMVTCTYCSFLRKFKAGGRNGSSGMPSGSYVEEFYANPAFMDLPFDGSSTRPKNLPTHESTLTNHQISTDKTTSVSPSTIPIENPQTVVTTVIGPAPYQMEPQYYVQGNTHISSTANGVDSAINDGEANSFSTESEREMDAGIPKLTECLSTDIVYANQGATGSFKEQEQSSDVLKSIENLQTERHITTIPPHGTVDVVTGSPKSNVLTNRLGVSHASSEEASVQECHLRLKSREEEPGSQEDVKSSGTWSKRVRRSFDDSYAARQSPSQQPIKKLKLNNSHFSNSDAKRVSRKGSRAKRKLQNSFSKVQKPIFRPRRRVAETQQTSEIIQNPFVV